MRKSDFCICENKGADQLLHSRIAEQHLYFYYIGSTILLLAKSEISSLWLSSLVVQPGLCQTWMKTPKTDILATQLNYSIFPDNTPV